jgi:hypothetical protein
MKKHTAKRDGFGLETKTFTGKSGKTYLVFRTPKGAFHAFTEIDAKEAAQDCRSASIGNTREQWKSIWTGKPVSQPAETKPSGKSALDRLRKNLG